MSMYLTVMEWLSNIVAAFMLEDRVTSGTVSELVILSVSVSASGTLLNIGQVEAAASPVLVGESTDEILGVGLTDLVPLVSTMPATSSAGTVSPSVLLSFQPLGILVASVKQPSSSSAKLRLV